MLNVMLKSGRVVFGQMEEVLFGIPAAAFERLLHSRRIGCVGSDSADTPGPSVISFWQSAEAIRPVQQARQLEILVEYLLIDDL